MTKFAHMKAEEIREIWQSRALDKARGVTAKVLGQALLLEHSTHFKILLKTTFGDHADCYFPHLWGYATIWPSGRIICEVIDRNLECRPTEIYESEAAMVRDFRTLADELKLDDADREEMFTILRKWIKRDLRVGPEGQKLAS